MPLVQIAGAAIDVDLHGGVNDYSDLLAWLTRTNLRSFLPGPWGPGDAKLAAEMMRRCATPPCEAQCFIVQHDAPGVNGDTIKMSGCSCTSGWQYTDDADIRRLEKCPPDDVWSDARALTAHHREQNRGANDPILGDCDDLSAICAATACYGAWLNAGKPMNGNRPAQPKELDVAVAIARPRNSQMAHAFMLSTARPPAEEPRIQVGHRWVYDPAARWGMRRPNDDFYTRGEIAVYPVRFADL